MLEEELSAPFEQVQEAHLASGGNEYVVLVNSDHWQPSTLGGQFFVQDTDQGSVQRLLVIRTMRGQSTSSGDLRVAKTPAVDAGGQQKSSESAGELQSVSPAAHCLASP